MAWAGPAWPALASTGTDDVVFEEEVVPADVQDAVDEVPFDEESGSNSYVVNGVPKYLTAPTRISIVASGPQGVCAVEFGRQQDTTAPWELTLSPGGGGWRDTVVVRLCDGYDDSVVLDTVVPFRVAGAVLQADGRPQRIRLANMMKDSDAAFTVTTSSGRTVARGRVDRTSSTIVKVPTGSTRSTETYQVTLVGDNDVTMTRPLIVAKGWTVFDPISGVAGLPFAQCQTVPWFYDPKGHPSNAKALRKDIELALRTISRHANLRFIQTGKAADARLTYRWSNLGPDSVAGVGGTDGSVRLNRQSSWLGDSFAGLGRRGRAWTVVHETMHTMGFDHSSSRGSIMYPVDYGQSRFHRGDVAGLSTMYSKKACPG
jgi:hypothetical protein